MNMTPRPIGSVRSGSILAVWNTSGFSAQQKIERRKDVRRMMRQNHESRPKGKGNHAWKRYEAMQVGCFHIAGNVYVQ